MLKQGIQDENIRNKDLENNTNIIVVCGGEHLLPKPSHD